MGSIIGSIIGGVGSLLGGQAAKSDAMTGYKYLIGGDSGSPGVMPINNTGDQANQLEANLLGLNGAGAAAAASPAFQNYLNSTDYNFQMDQGTRAITGSAAAKGLLNSGATAKALTQFGQGLAGNYFGNYINSLSGLTGQGLQAGGLIGQAGTQAGVGSSSAMQSGTTGLFGSLSGIAGANPIPSNFFGSALSGQSSGPEFGWQ